MDEMFYAPAMLRGEAVLDASESHHCINVKRHVVGDVIFVFDGRGGLYEAEIVSARKSRCTFMVVSEKKLTEPLPHIHMAVAPTKNVSRFEWMVEKVVEIGVSRITPMLCARSERKHCHTQRLERIVIEAAKQSAKLWLPTIDSMTAIGDLLKMQSTDRFIAHLGDASIPLKSAYASSSQALILIGPEGDFTPDELGAAKQAGFKTVSLGRHRLRTETAAMVACSTINLMYD